MKKLNKKGMTLMELVVAMLVFSVVSGAAAFVIAPIITVYHRANDLAECNTLLDSLSLELLGDIADAKSGAVIAPDEITFNTNTTISYSVNGDGWLCKNGSLVLDKAFYKRKTLKLEFLSANGISYLIIDDPLPNAFKVRFTLLDGAGSTLASRDYAVNPLLIQ
ncbi:MAG: prepilin-type N-terminal cleavage/methylation domain-containing protein [Oscillospiraceae bacterium]|nr:prepilin-type N-terminal cleavage/methylation domain-containing protein [Oscillospiraceae bacterium]